MKLLTLTGLAHFWEKVKIYMAPTMESLVKLEEQRALQILTNLNYNGMGLKVSNNLRRLILDYNGMVLICKINDNGGEDFLDLLNETAMAFSDFREEMPFKAEGFSITISASLLPLSGHCYSNSPQGPVYASSTGIDKALYERFMLGAPSYLLCPVYYQQTGSVEIKTWLPAYMTSSMVTPWPSSNANDTRIYEYTTPPIKGATSDTRAVKITLTVKKASVAFKQEVVTVS